MYPAAVTAARSPASPAVVGQVKRATPRRKSAETCSAPACSRAAVTWCSQSVQVMPATSRMARRGVVDIGRSLLRRAAAARCPGRSDPVRADPLAGGRGLVLDQALRAQGHGEVRPSYGSALVPLFEQD